jgi:transposase
VLTMDEVAWVECHIAAFNYFGGVVRRVVPDNLKAGVVKPDLYDPAINRTFGDLARHYDCLIDPARVRKPRDKARVERPVPYARDSFFAGRGDSFTSVAHMRTEALRWCDDVANVRPHRGIERVRPIDLFMAEERRTLSPLPARAFELARWSNRKVAPDIHVKVGRALYSVPWRHIGHEVECKQAAHTVEIYKGGVLVCTHARIERGRQTNCDHYPPEKIAFMMRTPQWCGRRAAELGEAVSELVGHLLEENALYRLRQAQGVVGLATAHGSERLEAACRLAISAGDPTYKTVKGILTNGVEDDAAPTQQVPSAPAHLHGPDVLFEKEA